MRRDFCWSPCLATCLLPHLSRLPFSLPFSPIYRIVPCLARPLIVLEDYINQQCEVVLPVEKLLKKILGRGCRRDRWVILYYANPSSGGSHQAWLSKAMLSISVISHPSISVNVRDEQSMESP